MKTTLVITILSFLGIGVGATVAVAGGRTVSATLTGEAEVVPGDADGIGEAIVTLNPSDSEVCFQLTISRTALATAAEIHEGAPGVAGPVVVRLSSPDPGGLASGCVTVQRDLIREILARPEAFYVNVRDAAHPLGALRGQLSR